MGIIAGIDPGKSGAVFVIDTEKCVFDCFDMPIRSLGPTSKRTEVDAPVLADWLYNHSVTQIMIEDVWSTPNDGHVGAFSFGTASGTLIGIAAGLNIPLDRVRPTSWKKTMKVSSEKKQSRDRATLLIPAAADLFKRVKDDGRAESALITLYEIFNLGLKISKPLEPLNV